MAKTARCCGTICGQLSLRPGVINLSVFAEPHLGGTGSESSSATQRVISLWLALWHGVILNSHAFGCMARHVVILLHFQKSKSDVTLLFQS